MEEQCVKCEKWFKGDDIYLCIPHTDIYYCKNCFFHDQPERSKREDHILVYKNENGKKMPIRDLFNPNYGCGALNSMET